MIRAIHRWPGLLAALFLLVLSLSGAALSLFPAAERLSAPQAEAGLSVGTLAGRILAIHPQIEQIRRAPSGKITAYWFEDGAPQAAIIDPATGRADKARASPEQLLAQGQKMLKPYRMDVKDGKFAWWTVYVGKHLV